MNGNKQHKRSIIGKKVIQFDKGDHIGSDGFVDVHSAILDFCRSGDPFFPNEPVGKLGDDEDTAFAKVDFEVIIKQRRRKK